MPQPIIGIDHVIIGVRDLERARLAWERLGFTLTPRGRHLAQGTGNYCVMFPEDYIELLGVVDAAQGFGTLGDFLAKGEGPGGLAFATSSADEAQRVLASRGLHPGAPRDLARQLELPEGTVLPRFKLMSLDAAETPGLNAFLCQHLTPELVRRPEWLRHPNGTVRIHGIVVMVEETQKLRQAYERLAGVAVNMTDEVLTVHLGRHRLHFATPDDVSALYPEAAIDLARKLPAIAVLLLGVSDPAVTADHLTQWQVAHDELADGSILVPAAEATNTLLIFRKD
jgi:catechol 2,3-dioxygenase-like lactoylglutathione lyase family enzyme